MTSATEILIEARRLIAEKGWVQGAYQTRRGGQLCFCADGAFSEAGLSAQFLHFRDARRFFKQVICGDPYKSEEIVEWNDAPGRTVEEVLAAFDRAIELSKQLA